MKLIESLEREGGHILMLWIVICYSLLIMSITVDPTVRQICHDIVVGGFSALLALLKSNGNSKPPAPELLTTDGHG